MPRTLHAITGPDRNSFLQGLITNDIARLSNGLVYAALLTPQGKYLADFFLLEKDDMIILDADDTISDGLIQRLSMYKLRANVQITALDLSVNRGRGTPPDGALTDPRHPDLGWRFYGDQMRDDETDWEAIRVRHCIPETGIELGPDSYILEAGFERLNGVDFRKGCYVGQEVTARMKHKAKLRKGLRTVHIEGTAPVGTAIIANGKEVGKIFTQSAGQAIAYLRFDQATDDMTAGGAHIHLT